MTASPTFPDRIHLEQIRRRLWSGREFGQAAVMVGAGFSINADKVCPGALDFPRWVDLGAKMLQALEPGRMPDSVDDLRVRVTTRGGPVRLASEYETIFGRAALDDLIVQQTPDQAYRPGRLHELLLSLPWSDVFTTNYDTLLERTRPVVYSGPRQLDS